nr:DNA-directed RNA polymerase III subunit RPC10-like [Ipomoea batatas]
MEFCPTCGMLLQYELPHMDRSARFYCPGCPYVCQIEPRIKIKRRQHLVKKKLDPVISIDSLETAATTKERCRNCGFDEAAFIQVQTRSADEAATIFYKCKSCKYQWNEN